MPGVWRGLPRGRRAKRGCGAEARKALAECEQSADDDDTVLPPSCPLAHLSGRSSRRGRAAQGQGKGIQVVEPCLFSGSVQSGGRLSADQQRGQQGRGPSPHPAQKAAATGTREPWGVDCGQQGRPVSHLRVQAPVQEEKVELSHCRIPQRKEHFRKKSSKEVAEKPPSCTLSRAPE
ncbi:hypothetical protein CEXT_263431 [Caerostris extrusa]|uniref:Uncharacterized protein n=1 Tax=Caerostris extrusa TaxID=172846 RepID=A0AAV4SCH6_CAEEX|nr:hypothetical protein CEXT_263431 [Caerostris extrusa]